jgi:hypothetical protein
MDPDVRNRGERIDHWGLGGYARASETTWRRIGSVE